jgi:hypothetical protein
MRQIDAGNLKCVALGCDNLPHDKTALAGACKKKEDPKHTRFS